MHKNFRITILLFILVLVAGNAYLTKFYSTDWDISLEAVVYPINGDGSEAVGRYIASLDSDDFLPLADFFKWEGTQYGLEIERPVTLVRAAEIMEQPPEPPYGGSVIEIMWWSLKMRYWAWKVDNHTGPPADIRIFVRYYDPAVYKELDHSIGLEKGMLCLVKAYASRHLQAKNNVIIAHEMLHALGATDKYNLETGLPLYPDGYAEPDRQPLYPQKEAELMGAVIALSESRAAMPESLREVMIGPATAREINWISD